MTAWMKAEGRQVHLWGAGAVRVRKSTPTHLSSPEVDAPMEASLASQARAERLAALKRALDEGSYRIPAEDIANKVIDRLRENPPRE